MRLLNPLRALAAIALLLAWLPAARAQGIARAAAQPLAATLNQTIYTPLFEGQSVTAFYVSGLTASGATLTVEGSNDAKAPTNATKTWFAASAIPTLCPGTPFTTLTADQSFRVDTAGMTDIRVRVSTGGTGTILVSFNAIPGASLASAYANCSAGGSGGSGTVAIPYSFTAMGGAQFNQAATVATALTIPTGAKFARICAVTSQMNFVDSTNGTPTTGVAPTVGTALAPGSCIFEQGATILSAFQIINAVASSGVWNASYFQ